MRTEELLFSEKQHFNMWLIAGVLMMSLIPLSIGVFSYFNGAQSSTPMGRVTLMVVTAIVLGVTALLAASKLETSITRHGIEVRLFPFQIKKRYFPWENIESVSVRQYNALFEYGGWGIKGFKSDRALNVRGDMGLQLVFKSGERLLIGTSKPEELRSVLKIVGNNQVKISL